MRFKLSKLLIMCAFLASTLFLSAYSFDSITEVINNSPISKNSTVAVSIREVQSEKLIYQKDADLLLHPASTLKAITTPVVLDTLGKNYNLTTGIYKDNNENTYLKLSADPTLNINGLSKLIKDFRAKGYKNIKGNLFIDDTLIDDIPWGTGWMWDDENNPYMPKFNAYNINRNLVTLKITPVKLNQKPKVEVTPYYTVKIINNAVTSTESNLFAGRKVWKDPEAIYIDGKISKTTEVELPVPNPEKFFKHQLTKALVNNKIKFSGQYKKSKLPKDAILISKISNNLINELKITNKQSDNLAAETLFKIAGAKFTGQEGSTENGLRAFNSLYSKLGIDTSEISIADASGVSQNDLITANWMTLALTKLYKSKDFKTYKNTLAVPTESGTLKNRLSDLKGSLFAKTGTNAGVSAITGYLTDKDGNTYAFSIIIQNFKESSKPAKELEDKILRALINP